MERILNEISAALDRLWERNQTVIQGRMESLESVLTQLDLGTLQLDTRNLARDAAHSLAGTLGMFGLPEGTQLARDLELAFEKSEDELALKAKLESVLPRMKLIIGNRKSGLDDA